MKLEDRRLPDAGFGVVAATLVLNGFDAGDILSIQTTAPDVHEFTLTDGIWDMADDDSGNLYSLSAGGKTLTVDNSAGAFDHVAVRTGMNDLASVEDGAAGIQMRSLAIHGADSVRFDAATNDFGTIIVEADSAVVNDGNDVALRDVSVSGFLRVTAVGDVIQSSSASLDAESLTINSDGNVDLNGITNLTNSIDVTATGDFTQDGTLTADTLTLSSGGTVTLSGSVTVANEVGITASGNVTQGGTGILAVTSLEVIQQGASGDVILDGLNDVDVLAISNSADGGEITFFDIDDLRIGTVGSTRGLDTNAGDINVTSVGDLRVSDDINAAHNTSTSAMSETITLISRGGDFILDDGLTITTDEDPTPGICPAATNDAITIAAGTDAGAGVVDLGSDVDIRTDHGVARQIAPRPQVFVAMPSAFFEAEAARNMRSGLQYVNGEFLGVMDLVFGVAGEENLQVVIDWGVGEQVVPIIPAGDAVLSTTYRDAFEFTLADADKTDFRIGEGGQRYFIPHLYSVTDLLRDADTRNGRQDNLAIIGVRFSVAQHESIQIWGSSVIDPAGSGAAATPNRFDFGSNPVTLTDAAGNSILLPDGKQGNRGIALLSSTDTNRLSEFPQQGSPVPFDRSRPTDSGVPEDQAEWEFVTGPPPGLVLIDPPPRPVGDIRPLTAPPEPGVVAEPSVVVDFGKGALTDAALGTQVFLEIRRQFEVDADAVTIVDRISDRGILSSRQAFEDFVALHPELQDGAGYEVWLVTETSGQGVQQPIVRFEITGGRPEPAIEQPPDVAEPLELRELEFEQPPTDEQGNDDPSRNDNTDATSMIPPPPLDDQPLSANDRAINALQAHPVESALIGAALCTHTARWRRRVAQTDSRSPVNRLSSAARRLRRLKKATPGSEHS